MFQVETTSRANLLRIMCFDVGFEIFNNKKSRKIAYISHDDEPVLELADFRFARPAHRLDRVQLEIRCV